MSKSIEVSRSEVAINVASNTAGKNDFPICHSSITSGDGARVLLVSIFITALFAIWAIAVSGDFYAQGEDSLQYIEVLGILEGKYKKVATLDELPVGILNRTPLYPVFLWFASIFAGNDAIWLTVLSNAFSTLCTLPFVLYVFGARFGLSVAVSAYMILAITIQIYFRTISAEWLCMHLLLLVAAVLLHTRCLSSRGAGFRMGLCSACIALCRPIETVFPVMALILLAIRRNVRESVYMLLACIPVILHFALQSYIAGFLTLSQISIISDYLLCSQLGEVSIHETDSTLLQEFIADSNTVNIRFDDEVLRQSNSLFGVSEGSLLYLEGVKNQDRTLAFKQRWNLSYGELNRLIMEYNTRARHEYALRHLQYLLSLWPLGVTLLSLFATVFLIGRGGFPDKQLSSLMLFFIASIVLVLGYTAYCSLPVTRYVLMQTFPLLYVFLVCLFERVFKNDRRLAMVKSN